MKHKIISIIIISIFSIAFFNCSEVEDNITKPAEPEGVHGSNALIENSEEFHGNLSEDGLEECKKCHDASFSGGLTTVSCIDCHPTINVHQENLASPASPNFHGKFLADNEIEMSKCKSCHGLEYQGGVSSPTCQTCHSGISVHKAGIVSPSSEDFHGNFLKNTNWDLSECKTCHNNDYSGGLVSSSCNTCHSGSNGPESCNTCHGNFEDESKIAPPRDLSGNTLTSAKGVGAHTSHLYENILSNEISCYECHPSSENTDNYVAAHIDGLPAEMAFGAFSSSGLSEPSYNSDLSCANTYCHGNFEFGNIKGNNFSPVWNIVDGTQAACGTCHGKLNGDGNLIPTPEGHFGEYTEDACIGCHPTAYNEDGSLNKSAHINGEPNQF